MNKVICYANLNCFNSSDIITDEHMKRYFDSVLDNEDYEIVDYVIHYFTDSEGYEFVDRGFS